MTPSPKLKEAVRLFNRRAYFDCHQLLEEVWQAADEADKPLYEALIRLSTGLHLWFHRGGGQGAVNLLTQAIMRLEDFRPEAGGVDVARLYRDVDRRVQDVKADPTPGVGLLERWKAPRIHLTA